MADSGITQVGKYHILELIGEGAMGVVYRAVDPVLNRTVAIKVMNDALAREEDLRARFLREAQAAGSLQHPNVITVYDFGEMEGHLFIAMEYVEGDDLERVLHNREPLPLQRKLDIVTDVLSGLAYAHKRGIVHRDIKPANIRLTEDRRAKIMDFGIAHLASSHATRTGVIVGTPDYMAPEQVTGGKITAATDLFSVGTVLYELLSGARPFQSTTVHGVLYKVVSEQPPVLQTLVPGLQPELYSIVQRALAKEPGSRFASALEMSAAVSAVRTTLSDLPLSAAPSSLHATLSGRATTSPRLDTPPPLPRTRVSGSRSRQLAAGVAVAAVIVAGAVWAMKARRDAPVVAAAAATDSTPAAPAPAGQPPVTTSSAAAVPTAAAPAPSVAVTPPRPTPPAAGAAAGVQQQLQQQLRQQARTEPTRGAVVSSPPPAAPPTAAAPAQTESASAAAATPRRPLPDDTTPSRTAETPRVVAAPPPVAAAPAAAVAPADPSAEIRGLVAAYARAIESREMSQLRRANTGLTAAQQRGFESFFESVRSLRASFTVDALEVNGPGAEARLTGAYDYVTKAGRTERQPLNFRATFRKDAGGSWQLTSVR